MIEFANPYYLLTLIAVIPLIIFIHFFSLKHTRRKALKFANFEAIEKVTGIQILSKNLTMLYLRLVMVLLFVLALSGVQFTYYGSITDTTYVLAIDSSTSMKATDIEPNRLEAAKTAASIFIDNLPQGSKAGIISFSGTAFLEQPLTDNKERLKEAILNIEIKEVGGTDLFSTIIASANLLKTSNEKGAIVLITDGQFNVKVLEDVLIYLEDEIPVHTLGIGTEQGGVVEGSVVSSLEEETLQLLANYSDGHYFNVNTAEEMQNAYSSIINIQNKKIKIDLSIWLLSLAICLLLVEWVLLSTRYKNLP